MIFVVAQSKHNVHNLILQVKFKSAGSIFVSAQGTERTGGVISSSAGGLVTRCAPQWEESRVRECADANPAAYCNLGTKNECVLHDQPPAWSQQVDSSTHLCIIIFWFWYIFQLADVITREKKKLYSD